MSSSMACVHTYHSEGYVQLRGFFDPSTLCSVRLQLEEIERSTTDDDKTAVLKGGMLFEVFDVARRGGALTALITDDRLISEAESLLTGPVTIAAALMLDKPPSANWTIRWHQDTSVYCRTIPPGEVGEIRGGYQTFRPRDNTMGQLVTARIPIDPDLQASGGLFVLPGTHKLGNLWPDGGTRFTGREGMAIEQVPGDLLFYNPLLMHRAGFNTLNQRRRVLQVTFRRQGQILPVGGEWIDW